METIRTTTELHDAAVDLLKRYRLAPAEARTPMLRDVAALLAEARQHFQRADGSPDLLGKTYNYRRYVTEIYDDSGIPKSELPRVQAAVRYHVSTALRERYDRETLAEYGLDVADGREKSQERRASRAALVAALSSRTSPPGWLSVCEGLRSPCGCRKCRNTCSLLFPLEFFKNSTTNTREQVFLHFLLPDPAPPPRRI